MSTPFALVVFGCPLPEYGSIEQEHIIEELRDECGYNLPAKMPAWRKTYTAHDDRYWFGVVLSSNAGLWTPFNTLTPDDNDDPRYEAVWEAWRELPAETRDILGEPKTYLMVGLS